MDILSQCEIDYNKSYREFLAFLFILKSLKFLFNEDCSIYEIII